MAAAAAKDLKVEKRCEKETLPRFKFRTGPVQIPFSPFSGNLGCACLRFTSLFQYCMTSILLVLRDFSPAFQEEEEEEEEEEEDSSL